MRRTWPRSSNAAARCERVGNTGMGLDRREQLIARQSQLAQCGAHAAHPDAPALGLRIERNRKQGGGRVDPQPEHVDRLVAPGSGNLDPGYQADAHTLRCRTRFRKAGQRVVIGEREHAHTRRCSALDELPRGERSVRAMRVGVKVDPGLVAHEGAPASPTALRFGPAITMKPCERSKPSLV